MSNLNAYDTEFLEAARAVFDTLEPERQSLAQRIGRLNTSYVSSSQREKLLDEAFDTIVDNVAAALFGEAAKRRAIFVVGESGSGKTTAVVRHISKRKTFAPRLVNGDEEVRPLVAFEAPKPLTLKGVAAAGLAALKYPVNKKNLDETEIFNLWKQQLKEQRVLFLWIDEMQHVLRGNTTKEIQNVADVIKSLVQIPGWPLHLILSGVPALAQFLHLAGGTDGQLKERSGLVELHPLQLSDSKKLLKILKKIATEDARLKLEGIETEEFAQKIIHACNGAFGSCITVIRAACVNAMRGKRSVLACSDFAAAYAFGSGCRPSQNVFLMSNWQDIIPANSLGELLTTSFMQEAQHSSIAKKSKRAAASRKEEV
ncbi:TniB family NTP-binding protein [Agrobacterium cavarae]|uniref:TniB family NTP-binding protein n=1 Tax=Agrobacterium cavarae TaxID=2528239 RepID=UPI003EE662E1